MTEDHARILAFNRRLNEIGGNTSKLGTRIIDVMDADTITVPKSDFLDIKRQLLVILKHLPQFVDRVILCECYLTCSNSHEKYQKDYSHIISQSSFDYSAAPNGSVDAAHAGSRPR